MKGTRATGWALLLGGLVLAAVIAFGLYDWDQRAREAEVALRPQPVAPLAAAPTPPSVAPAPALAVVASSSPAPGTDPAVGQQVFTRLCSGCHPSANAGVGPALHGQAFSQRYPDDAAIASFVRAGRGGMPAFSTSLVSDADLANIIAYLRTLSAENTAATNSAPVATPATVAAAPALATGGAVSASPSPATSLSQAQLSQIQPGLSGYMLDAAKRLARSWFAAQAGNWDESAFEVREAEDGLHRGGLKSSMARQQAIDGVNSAFLAPLITVAQAGDMVGFESAYRATLQGCNACHAAQTYAATGRSLSFIRVQVPTSSIWDIYDFSGQGR